MPPESWDGYLAAASSGEADHADPQQRELRKQRLRHRVVLADRQLDVLRDGERGKQRAALEHHAVAPLDVEQFALRPVA